VPAHPLFKTVPSMSSDTGYSDCDSIARPDSAR
jgi:hypothetical protein